MIKYGYNDDDDDDAYDDTNNTNEDDSNNVNNNNNHNKNNNNNNHNDTDYNYNSNDTDNDNFVWNVHFKNLHACNVMHTQRRWKFKNIKHRDVSSQMRPSLQWQKLVLVGNSVKSYNRFMEFNLFFIK